jgi:sulfite dehydrogenase (cytochrome) subunit B
MKTTWTFAAISGVLACLLSGATVFAKEMKLPDEQIQWRESTLPGYQKTLQNCMLCHSAHYAEYQPRTSGRNFWEAQVKRMKTVFNAPIPEADIADITDYLYATYSTDKAKAEAKLSSAGK